MVNKITTPPTQNEVIDKINELVDGKQDTITSSNKLSASLVSGLATVATSGSYNDLSNKPTVDQTYSATSINAQSGVAVASAIGNGSVTINQGGTPRGTFTMNQSSNLTIDLDGTSGVSAIAILNKNTASPYQTLGVWQGTESQWTNGELKTWYNWKTNTTVTCSTSTLPYTGQWLPPVYGNGRFITMLSGNSKKAVYSTDGGATWNDSGLLPSQAKWQGPAYGNGVFVTVASESDKAAYSTDGGATWQSATLPTTGSWQGPTYGNRVFVTVAYGTDQAAYSTDGGATWQSSTLPVSGNWNPPVYGGGRFLITENVNTTSSKSLYSDNGGVTWQSATLTASAKWIPPTYGNGKFIIIKKGYYNDNTAYLLDGSSTWQKGTSIAKISWIVIAYGDGIFVALSTGTEAVYSTDGGATWQKFTIPLSRSWWQPAYGNGSFVFTADGSSYGDLLTISFTSDSCYTDTANPTTTSVVYSVPNTASALTISSVTSGAITLSNNNTYYYNQSGNQYTYDTIGNSHPEYLCFIDGVGVKMGNTFIATNNSNS